MGRAARAGAPRPGGAACRARRACRCCPARRGPAAAACCGSWDRMVVPLPFARGVHRLRRRRSGGRRDWRRWRAARHRVARSTAACDHGRRLGCGMRPPACSAHWRRDARRRWLRGLSSAARRPAARNPGPPAGTPRHRRCPPGLAACSGCTPPASARPSRSCRCWMRWPPGRRAAPCCSPPAPSPGLELLETAAAGGLARPGAAPTSSRSTCPCWVGRFLDGWRPDAAGVRGERAVAQPARRRAGRAKSRWRWSMRRLSERSARRWRHVARLGREMIGRLHAWCWRNRRPMPRRFTALGAGNVRAPGNLKEAAAPLPADPAALAALRAAIGDRPMLLAASTHPGEEAIVLAAHRLLLTEIPGLLTVLAPRHPNRGPELAALAAGQGLPAARRGRANCRGRQPRSMWRIRSASWGCSTGLPRSGWSAGPWCRMAGRIRWSRRGSAARSCSAPGHGQFRRTGRPAAGGGRRGAARRGRSGGAGGSSPRRVIECGPWPRSGAGCRRDRRAGSRPAGRGGRRLFCDCCPGTGPGVRCG